MTESIASASFISLGDTSHSSSNGQESSLTKRKSSSKPLVLAEVDKELMVEISNWLERLPLSRPKSTWICQSRIERELADGCLVAEVIAQHHPKLVDMHNYVKGSSSTVKRNNWHHLRRKVLSKLDLHVSDQLIEMIIESKPGAIDGVLQGVYEIAMRVEAERREAEEEMARQTSDPFPIEDWKQDICYVRKDPKGQREYMIHGKLMVQRDQMLQDIQARDNELKELRTSNELLRSQVARLQMTVDLKEDRLGELTHQLSLYHRPTPEGKTAEDANENIKVMKGEGDQKPRSKFTKKSS